MRLRGPTSRFSVLIKSLLPEISNMPLEVRIHPYKVRDGEVVEWHLSLIDLLKPKGQRIIDTRRVQGTYEDALKGSSGLMSAKPKKGRWRNR